MKHPSLKNKMKPKKLDKKHPNSTDFLLDQNHGLYVEDYFTEMLSYERKRTERSKRPFLLMLLNIEGFSQVDRKNGVIRKVVSALFASTREIDIKGWYKNDSIIGILFTELNGIENVSLNDKIHKCLYNVLGMEGVNKMEITLYRFPEENGDQGPDNEPDSTLYPDIGKRESSQKGPIVLKRILDIIGSIGAMILFSPFFFFIPLCIKLTSKGPILFKQERIGQFGKKFTFLKFRSMYINNDSNIHQDYVKKLILEQSSYNTEDSNKGKVGVYKIKDDPRITSVGKFLRKTSLDELPQFYNVLRGEMSLVGPRPPVAYETKIYDIWHRRRIMEVKPGITGLWQTNGRSSTNFDEMVRLDIQYIVRWSLWLDIKILFQTPWVILR